MERNACNTRQNQKRKVGASRRGRSRIETVVRTIIALGREIKMRVTVEGVETAGQVDFLYDAHADRVQGFYFGRPVPAKALSAEVLANLLNSAASPVQEGASEGSQWV